ncbi:hypothetical protein DICPUDRAFT_147471 [Dictyostelium purpureum]|uniref:alpha-1,2-Mannosidase n=1 Tax=Dictyostelium purpureum TaxID=5786 RepID=F0Z8K2_DICPU|nr:uncharacterized protein DICPUDRAFT_147471 [Dictyostelium purpureum]EGC39740.1 hypothetical protein DICPUDRAFT_147471 [Dictyostelium purpureum]|eukprot:XP_003283726.1 hypothetical protein DICPUDRAFT_147471 [Dictyostelium purpureum]
MVNYARKCSLISIGRQGDSYYEYLLKMWIYTDGEDEKYSRYLKTSADLIIEHLYRKTKAGYGFIGTLKDNVLLVNEDHLTCFVDGMFALAAAVNITGNDEKNEIYMEVGREVTRTCADSYFKSPIGLGPEIFGSDQETGEIALSEVNAFLLRPETVESIFILYRLTGDTMYQDRGWAIFEAIEKYCRISNGYIGYRDFLTGSKNTVQQSFLWQKH